MVGVGATGVIGAVAATGTSSAGAAVALVDLVARGLVTLAVLGASLSASAAAFLVRFGFSATGSRFKPFSSA